MRVVMSRSSIRLFGVFAMAAAFGLVTAYRAPGQGEVVAPPRQLDFKWVQPVSIQSPCQCEVAL